MSAVRGCKTLVPCLVLLGCAACGSTNGTQSTAHAQSVSVSTPTSGVHLHIEFPAHEMRAGQSMTASVVIDNDTGSAMNLTDSHGCRSSFAVALGNAEISPTAGAYTVCVAHPLTIAPGRSQLPVSFGATYSSCLTFGTATATQPHCLAEGRIPPLPKGEYKLYFVDHGTGLPSPNPIPILVASA